jgi:glycine oxidase
MTRDVIIAGGGIIGASIALRLARSGLKVTLVERGRIGCEASRAAAGMLAPQTEAVGTGHFLDLCLRSRSLYRDFAAQLTEMSGINVEYRDEGVIFVALEEEDRKRAEEWASWQPTAGLALESLTPLSLGSLEPAVTGSATGAVFIPGDHQVENRKLMDAFAVALPQAGVEVIEGSEVTRVITDGKGATGVACGVRRLEAGAVVVAAGSWSSRLLEPLGLNAKIIPARGQMVALKCERALISRVLHSSKCYVVPRADGRVLIGATVEYVGFQKGVSADDIARLLANAVEIVPALARCRVVEAWSGLRPDTIDHLPILGPSGVERLLLATGHFRNGILLAPVTAELISEVILSGRVTQELREFGLDRFGASAATKA